MTLTQMRTAVRTATRVSSAKITDAELTTWINEGLYRVSSFERHWPWLEDDDTFVTVADQQAYAVSSLAADVERISVLYSDTKRTRLQEIDRGTALENWGGDMPTGQHAHSWFIWGSSIYLIPIPDTADVQYNALYYKSPTALSADGDDPEWDAQFHDILVHYCEMRVWMHEEEPQKAGIAKGLFFERLDDMRKWYRDRADDSPWAIGVPPLKGVRHTNTPFLGGL